MTTLLKHGARKSLASCNPSFGYGMRKEVHGGEYGATITVTNEENNSAYTLYLTDHEIDRLVKCRDSGKAEIARYT